jgi:hypothetical protein
MSERFRLSSVTGYPIPPVGTWRRTEWKPRTIWSLLDSANCFRPVGKSGFGERARERLQRQADRMNALDQAGEL